MPGLKAPHAVDECALVAIGIGHGHVGLVQVASCGQMDAERMRGGIRFTRLHGAHKRRQRGVAPGRDGPVLGQSLDQTRIRDQRRRQGVERGGHSASRDRLAQQRGEIVGLGPRVKAQADSARIHTAQVQVAHVAQHAETERHVVGRLRLWLRWDGRVRHGRWVQQVVCRT